MTSPGTGTAKALINVSVQNKLKPTFVVAIYWQNSDSVVNES